jgi:hypothetical protein
MALKRSALNRRIPLRYSRPFTGAILRFTVVFFHMISSRRRIPKYRTFLLKIVARGDDRVHMVLSWNTIARTLRFVILLLLLLLLLQVLPAYAISPENIGASQYGIGYLAAAEKLDRDADKFGERRDWPREKTRRLYDIVEQGLTGSSQNVRPVLAQVPEQDRKSFIRLVVHLQERVSKKSPWLFMIGADRAVATDGHHKVRSLQRLNDLLDQSHQRWPRLTREVLEDRRRISRKGVPQVRIPFKNPVVLARYPANVPAAEVMRGILAQRMGLWESAEDTALARRYYGSEAGQRASIRELNHLASRLGIEDMNSGIIFREIRHLPDNPFRSQMGVYFESRGLKAGDVGYVAYTEFFVGDRVRQLALQNPERYQNILKFLAPNVSIEQQRALLAAAIREVDDLYASQPGLRRATVDLSTRGSRDVEKLLEKLKKSYCRGNPL